MVCTGFPRPDGPYSRTPVTDRGFGAYAPEVANEEARGRMATLGEFGYLADYLLQPGGTLADQSVGGSHFAVAFGLIFFTSVLPYVVLTSS